MLLRQALLPCSWQLIPDRLQYVEHVAVHAVPAVLQHAQHDMHVACAQPGVLERDL